jgi:hypothetical protein
MSKCVRFHIDNYLDLTVLANSDVSSEQTAFPVTNAYNKNRRSKVWRSNGYYQVTSSNNGIVFNDGTGNVTASIAVGEYSSTASFMAAVDAALEAAGVANYTVTQNANLKFVISSDLSGGATVFQLITTNAGFTAIDLLGFDNSANKTGASSYTSDVVRINSSEWIRWDMGISTNPDSFFLIGPRNKPLKIAPNATITLQGNETNNFTTPSYSQAITYDDEVLAIVSETGFNTAGGLRYWQVVFDDRTNPLGYIELGAMSLSNFYSPTRGGAQFPLQSNLIDRTETIFSEGGQTFSDIKETSAGFNLTWSALKKDELEALVNLFNKVGIGVPFFITLDAEAGFSTSVNRSIKYVKFKDEPSYRLVSPNNFSMEMKFEEQL